ncbi:response regulator [bacterium]|jgi:DNA-binding response OmpR family regulator|nr:response regulator [bacterium]
MRYDGQVESNGKTVLLVDDDNEIVASMRAVLESKGFRILTASDGNAGLAIAERENPDLIVVDMMMPKKSGFLVVEKIKRSTNAPPMIMITANEGSRHRAYAELLGVDTYLRKPFAMEKLVDEVRRLTLGDQ